MKNVIALTLLFILPLIARAASDLTGVLVGNVVDARNNAPLAGAEVRLSDQTTSLTGTDGSFIIRNVPEGPRQVVVSYLGYKVSTATVSVAANQRASADFRLELADEAIKLAAFQVTAEYDADTRARNSERNSSSFTNIISSDALGNLPDAQVADAMRRLPGVSTLRFHGESTTVIIRGADPSLNSVNLDGVPIQSNQNDGNSVDLTMFTVEQLNSIKLVKAVTADLPGDSVGGYVNFETKSPLDYKRRVLGLRLKVGYDNLERRPTPEAGVTYVTQFGSNKQFGTTISASYQKRFAQSWRVESGWSRLAGPIVTPAGTFTNIYMPTSVEARINHVDRDRYVLSLGFDWNVRADTRLFVKANVNTQLDHDFAERTRQFTSARNTSGFDLTKPFRVDGDDIVEVTATTKTAGDNMQRGVAAKTTKQVSTIFKTGGRSDLNNLRLDYSLGYSRMKVNYEQVVPLFALLGTDYHYYRPTADRPHFDSASGIDLNDPSRFQLNSLQDQLDRKDYDLWDLRLDATYSPRLFGQAVSFKIGGVASRSEKERDDSLYIPAASANFVPLINGQVLLLSDPLVKLVRMPTSYLESYDLGYGPEAKAADVWGHQLVHSDRLVRPNAATLASNLLSNDYNINQDIYAAYSMVTFKLGSSNNIAGLRYEKTSDEGTAYAINGVNVTPISNERGYGFWAPNLQSRIRMGEKWQMRMSYTETMRRPGYDSAAPRTTWSVAGDGSLRATTFNSALKQQTSENVDVSLEYYMGKTNRITVAGFTKNINDTLYTELTTMPLSAAPVQIQELFPTSINRSEEVAITRQANGGTGKIRGVEFEYLQRFTFLPGVFSGLGFSGNFAYIDSTWNRFVANNVRVTTAFPSQSRTTGNAGLSFARGKWYGLLSYNWRAPFLISVNQTDRKLDQWNGNAESIDWKVVYQFKPRLSFELRGQNMKRDADTVWAGEDHTRLITYARTGVAYWLGVNWEL